MSFNRNRALLLCFGVSGQVLLDVSGFQNAHVFPSVSQLLARTTKAFPNDRLLSEKQQAFDKTNLMGEHFRQSAGNYASISDADYITKANSATGLWQSTSYEAMYKPLKDSSATSQEINISTVRQTEKRAETSTFTEKGERKTIVLDKDKIALGEIVISILMVTTAGTFLGGLAVPQCPGIAAITLGLLLGNGTLNIVKQDNDGAKFVRKLLATLYLDTEKLISNNADLLMNKALEASSIMLDASRRNVNNAMYDVKKDIEKQFDVTKTKFEKNSVDFFENVGSFTQSIQDMISGRNDIGPRAFQLKKEEDSKVSETTAELYLERKVKSGVKKWPPKTAFLKPKPPVFAPPTHFFGTNVQFGETSAMKADVVDIMERVKKMVGEEQSSRSQLKRLTDRHFAFDAKDLEKEQFNTADLKRELQEKVVQQQHRIGQVIKTKKSRTMSEDSRSVPFFVTCIAG